MIDDRERLVGLLGGLFGGLGLKMPDVSIYAEGGNTG